MWQKDTWDEIISRYICDGTGCGAYGQFCICVDMPTLNDIKIIHMLQDKKPIYTMEKTYKIILNTVKELREKYW